MLHDDSVKEGGGGGGGVTSLLTASNMNRHVLVSFKFPRKDSVHLARGYIVC